MVEAFPQTRVTARCPDHPEITRGLIFDLECKRVLCLECRKPPDNHKDHKKEIIDIVLTSTDEQMQTIRNCYPLLNATFQTTQDALCKEQETDERHAKALIEAGDEWLVDAVARLLQLTDRLHKVAKQPHAKPVAPPADGAAGWTTEEASVRINELKTLTARANDDENVSLTCENEALQLREQIEMWTTSAKRQLAETSCIPVNAVAQFKSFIQKCNEALTNLETEFVKVLERLTFWKNVNEINLINSQVIEIRKLNENKKEKLSIFGIAEAQAHSMLYLCDVSNASIKQLNLQTSQYNEVYKATVGYGLCGLFGPVIAPQLNDNTSIYVSMEYKNVEEADLIVMREEIKGLINFQRIVLPVKANDAINVVTFAKFKENLLCAIAGFNSIYELVAEKGSSETRYIERLREHAMPTMVLTICSLEVDGEWRLAATSFSDGKVTLFGMKNAQLTPLTRLEMTNCLGLSPIPTTNAILSNRQSEDKKIECTSIELNVLNENGRFGDPLTILPAERGLDFLSHCVFRNSIDGRLCAAMFDFNSESLHLFDFC